MKKIILTTTESFAGVVALSDLKDQMASRGVETILHDNFLKPFPFPEDEIVAIVAGHTPQGVMLKVGPPEATLFPNLRFVGPFGIGVNHLDIPGLEEMGIVVKIPPHLSKRTVAELTLAFIFGLARRLAPMTQAMQNSLWQREDAVNIFGKTLGIIGLGAIGKEVAKLAKVVGMRVMANDPVCDKGFLTEFGVEQTDKEKIIREADFLTLHVPLTDETKNLIDRAAIAKMKKGSYLINVARGGVIDETALLEALQRGSLAGAALDVFSIEPPFSNEMLTRLIKLPNVIATPHVGAFTFETRYQIAQHLWEQILATLV